MQGRRSDADAECDQSSEAIELCVCRSAAFSRSIMISVDHHHHVSNMIIIIIIIIIVIIVIIIIIVVIIVIITSGCLM